MEKNVLKEIKNLCTSKALQESDIPTELIKDNSDIFADSMLASFNTCIANSELSLSLKLENITPAHYRFISMLPNTSKI